MLERFCFFFNPVDNLTLCQLVLVDPSLAFLRVELTGRLKGWRPYIIFPFSMYLRMNKASGLWGKEGELSYHIVHRLQAFPLSCSAREGDYCCRKKKKIWPHCRNNHRSSDLPPPPSVLSLSLSLSVSPSLSGSLCEAPADSGCIHPYINHSPYSIGYMVHGKYWFFPLPHCWRTLGFCETEKEKEKKKDRLNQIKQNPHRSSV